MDILKMSKDELLNLNPEDVVRELSCEEVFHIFQELGGLWLYNYKVAKKGKVGLHAELKSGRCSNGFLYSKIVLQHDNLRRIFAQQMAMKFWALNYPKPTYIAGIPDGATKLGEDVADIIGVKRAEIIKEDGKITILTTLRSGESLLLVEDFCTKGTGFLEAVKSVHLMVDSREERAGMIFPIELVVINRGGLKFIEWFKVIALIEQRIMDWDPSDCPLCEMGSKRIKPKATEENWRLIANSQ